MTRINAAGLGLMSPHLPEPPGAGAQEGERLWGASRAPTTAGTQVSRNHAAPTWTISTRALFQGYFCTN